MKKLISILMVLCLMATLGVSAFAADYPERPVTAVVGWSVGGGQDLMVRAAGNYFPEYSGGQPLVVQNIEGGSSVVGCTEYLTMEADGYNILSWNTAQGIKTHMQETAYTIDDFKPICNMVAENPYILVKADCEFETLADLVEWAKANPGELTVGNSGTGGGNHLAALQLELVTGIEVNHIGYDGGAKSAQAVLSGEIMCSVNSPAEGLSSVEAGDLRMLCLFGDQRSDFFPDVPTALESGYEVIDNQLRGFIVHKSVSDDVVAALEEIFRQVAENPEFVQACADLGKGVRFMGAEEYAEFLATENALYEDIIKTNGLGDKY